MYSTFLFLAIVITVSFYGLGTYARCGIANERSCRCSNLLRIKCVNSKFGRLPCMDLAVKRKMITLNLMNNYISMLTSKDLKDYIILRRLDLRFQRTGECVLPVDLTRWPGLMIRSLCSMNSTEPRTVEEEVSRHVSPIRTSQRT